jgi:5-methylcytosine-specific restriction protein A
VKKKKGNSSEQIIPPPGISGGKTVNVIETVPTDGEILEVAKRLHAEGEHCYEIRYGWPFVYMPRHALTITIDNSELTGREGWKDLGTDVSHHQQDPTCLVGFISVWMTKVVWTNGDDNPTLQRFREAESPVPSLDVSATLFAEPTIPPVTFREGDVDTVLADVYERNEAARRACIAHYGATCQACKLDFMQRYGKIGQDFIHVHHLTPLSEIGVDHVVHPIKDLRPVCPNCHAMLHRNRHGMPPLSIDALREILQRQDK